MSKQQWQFNLQHHADPPANTTTSMNTGSGSLATKPQAYYDRMLLELRRQRSFLHRNWAQPRPMPKNYGDTVQFRRITKLEPSLTPLTEGVTPDGSTGKVEAISATTQQYGDFMEFTDRVSFQMVDDVLREYTKEQGIQANETLDLVTLNELTGGTNVFYAGGKSSRATLAAGDTPTLKDFRKIILAMRMNHVKPAWQGDYVAIVSPAVEFDLLDDPDFHKILDYAGTAKPLYENEFGRAYNIRFVSTENAKVFEEAGVDDVNVHASIVLGNQAYGITDIKGEGDIQAIVKALGSSGTSDPLNQRQTIGWKVNAFVAKRLDELAVARYESVPTQN